jgi:hypothetical protein
MRDCSPFEMPECCRHVAEVEREKRVNINEYYFEVRTQRKNIVSVASVIWLQFFMEVITVFCEPYAVFSSENHNFIICSNTECLTVKATGTDIYYCNPLKVNNKYK